MSISNATNNTVNMLLNAIEIFHFDNFPNGGSIAQTTLYKLFQIRIDVPNKDSYMLNIAHFPGDHGFGVYTSNIFSAKPHETGTIELTENCPEYLKRYGETGWIIPMNRYHHRYMMNDVIRPVIEAHLLYQHFESEYDDSVEQIEVYMEGIQTFKEFPYFIETDSSL